MNDESAMRNVELRTDRSFIIHHSSFIVLLTAYGAALCLVWPALYSYYFLRSVTDGKYRGNYQSRMGIRLPAPLNAGRERVWIHALSVGETLSAIPLIAELKLMRPDIEIILSAATEAGMSIARQRLDGLVEGFFFTPHDFPWAVNGLIKRIRPSLFVLVESDFWPNLTWRLNKQSIPTVLVNARMSPRSFRRYCRLGALAKIIFGGFALILTQTELDRARFIRLCGMPERVVAAGNLKFESSLAKISAPEIASIRADIGLEAGRRVWVAGSTHEGEEQMLLRIHRDLCTRVPDLLLVIAPRKIHRGGQIAALASGLGFTKGIRSKGESAGGKQVYVLDTLGELARIYAVCDIAFLGGSLVPIGGHNPLEAIAQGAAVCWGPHFFNFAEVERALLAAGCATRVCSELELSDFLLKTLSDPVVISKMAKAAGDFAALEQDAAKRIACTLLEKMVRG
ncbi:MAG TPA: 3-deoxy-D-manno-octulosonic acid transferase [Syntrophobacteraceae bacterium]|nr:3-deoxy-D-manno-octulosonic acid transferase [Syntrophobacteraceae bacterium]